MTTGHPSFYQPTPQYPSISNHQYPSNLYQPQEPGQLPVTININSDYVNRKQKRQLKFGKQQGLLRKDVVIEQYLQNQLTVARDDLFVNKIKALATEQGDEYNEED